MSSILKENIYQKIREYHKSIENELRYRGRLRLGKTMDAIESMLNLLILRDSWEQRGVGKC